MNVPRIVENEEIYPCMFVLELVAMHLPINSFQSDMLSCYSDCQDCWCYSI